MEFFSKALARGVVWFTLIIVVVIVQTNWSYFQGVGPEIKAKSDALIYMLSSNQFFMSILGINFMLTLVAIGFYSTNNRLVRLQNNYLEINGYTSYSEKSLNNFTYENYNDALIGLASTRAKHVVDLLGIAALTFIAIPAAPAIFSTYELALHGLKVSWLVSLPHLVLQNVGLLSMSKKDFNITPSTVQLSILDHGCKRRCRPFLKRVRRLYIIVIVEHKRSMGLDVKRAKHNRPRPIHIEEIHPHPQSLKQLSHNIRTLDHPSPMGGDARLLDQATSPSNIFFLVPSIYLKSSS